MIVLAALLACSNPAPRSFQPVEVEVYALDQNASGGVLVVQTSYADGLEVSLPSLEVEGLTFSISGEPTQERLGGRTVVTQRFRYTGKRGSYEIPALVVSATNGETTGTSLPLWLDLGTTGPMADAMADIDEPPPVLEIPWGWIFTALGIGGLLVGGLVVGFAGLLTQPRVVRRERLPPDIRCLSRWSELRMADLPDEEKAKELSLLFREYTQEALAFPAVSWTTSEILAHLEGMQHLESANTTRAKRLLTATDLVKYAEVSPDLDFFDELDADLRAFVASTRPHHWETSEIVEEPVDTGRARVLKQAGIGMLTGVVLWSGLTCLSATGIFDLMEFLQSLYNRLLGLF